MLDDTQLLKDTLASLELGLALCRLEDGRARINHANPALCQLTGYSCEELAGMDLAALCRPQDAPDCLARLKQPAAGETRSLRLRIQRKDGTQFWGRLQLSLCAAGSGSCCLAQLGDVSAEVAAEEALAHAKERERLLLDGIGSPVMGLSHDLRLLFCNQSYARATGCSVEEIEGQPLLELFPSFEQTRSFAAIKTALETGQRQTVEGDFLGRYYHAVIYPTPWGVLGIAEDYTERRQFEEDVLARDRLLMGFARSSSLLLGGARDDKSVYLALAELGRAAAVDRVYLFENHPGPDGLTLTSQRYEWVGDGIEAQIDNPELQGFGFSENLGRWEELLSRNDPVYGQVKYFPDSERAILEPQDIKSILVAPVIIQRQLWGFIGFDDCTTLRQWRQGEIGVLMAAAGSIGGAIARIDAEASLARERSLLSQVIDSIPDIVFYKGLDHRYLGCNQAFARFAGRSREGLTGLTDFDLFDEETAEFFQQKDREVLQDGRPRHNDEWITYPDGHRALLDTLKAPLLDAYGQPMGVLGVSRDITEKHHLEQQQREFVDNVSHELRTPIAALLGMVETLQRPGLPTESFNNLLAQMDSQVMRLARLVDDILSLSALDSARRTMERKRVDLCQLSHAVADTQRVVAQEKQVALECRLPGDPVETVGDPQLLELLAGNLLSNAIKYTPEGGRVRITVEALGTTACLEVRDTGIGIDPAEQERIFERFYRVDKARSRQAGGTGLGLAIVSQVLELHRGTITVDSIPGKGSTFRACLPRLRE